MLLRERIKLGSLSLGILLAAVLTGYDLSAQVQGGTCISKQASSVVPVQGPPMENRATRVARLSN